VRVFISNVYGFEVEAVIGFGSVMNMAQTYIDIRGLGSSSRLLSQSMPFCPGTLLGP